MLEIIRARIKQMREQQGWTQSDLAKKIGVKQSTIAGYESSSPKSAREPDLSTVVKIAQVLGTSSSYLLGETDDPRPLIESGQAAHHVEHHRTGEHIELTPEDIQDIERAMIEIERRRAARRKNHQGNE